MTMINPRFLVCVLTATVPVVVRQVVREVIVVAFDVVVIILVIVVVIVIALFQFPCSIIRSLLFRVGISAILVAVLF